MPATLSLFAGAFRSTGQFRLHDGRLSRGGADESAPAGPETLLPVLKTATGCRVSRFEAPVYDRRNSVLRRPPFPVERSIKCRRCICAYSSRYCRPMCRPICCKRTCSQLRSYVGGVWFPFGTVPNYAFDRNPKLDVRPTSTRLKMSTALDLPYGAVVSYYNYFFATTSICFPNNGLFSFKKSFVIQ